MRKTIMTVFVLCLTAVGLASASYAQEQPLPQRPRYNKLSPMLRKIARQSQASQTSQRTKQFQQPQKPRLSPSVCAFVKIADGGEATLQEHGCRVLAQVGDICIADIPKNAVGPLSLDRKILRIEANRSTHPLTDSVARQLNALPVYAGQELPKAYTGKGVVVGVMDIGFDLTHPNFYSRDTTEYRISRFWDMISADTVGSTFYVGRDYAGREELLALGHARDGEDQTHGTHTLGIAAGSGYDSPYRGLAPESDICIVANAVAPDTIYIDPKDYDKYTFATDALGFKYIFDYAQSMNRPCVINFSEGSDQDFWGYDVLYYEMLSRLTGPGRIIVSSAGNNGNDKTWFCKAAGEKEKGSFLRSSKHSALVTLKADGDFALRLVAYGNKAPYYENDTLIIDTRNVVVQEDSVLSAKLYAAGDSVEVEVSAYPSCYNANETCYDVSFNGNHSIGSTPIISFEAIGEKSCVEAYRVQGNFVENSLNPKLSAGEKSHSVLSPATAPNVICVGATAYRTSITNYMGILKEADNGTGGVRSPISAIGPSYDGRLKPEVMAPGINIISSYSSYYMENHPDARDLQWNVSNFTFGGRTYGWNSNSGTSMSSPAVAGVIALWLQACPTLSPDDVIAVFKRTCRHYDPTMEYPNNLYGYGEIDAYRGLLDILGVDQVVVGISATPTKAQVSFTQSGELEVLLPGTLGDATPHSTVATISVYSLAGRLLARGQMAASSNTFRIKPQGLHTGDVYVVQIDGDKRYSGSMLVRR